MTDTMSKGSSIHKDPVSQAQGACMLWPLTRQTSVKRQIIKDLKTYVEQMVAHGDRKSASKVEEVISNFERELLIEYGGAAQ